MKFLVVISACLAVSSGSILPFHGHHAHGIYGGHHGLVGHHGLAGHHGLVGPYAGPLADVAPASFHGLVGHPNGAVTPIDTPSVAAARADHLAAKGAIYAAHAPALVAAPAVPAIAYAGYAGPLADALPASAAGLVSHPNGAVTPADTPSVVAARAEHLAARDAAYAVAAPIAAPAYAAGFGYGLPAVAAHTVAAPAFAGYAVAAPAFAGHAVANAGLPFAHAAGPIAPYAAGVIPTGLLGSPTGALVHHPNGAVVPADEPAVVAARADHLAAKGLFH